MKLAILVATVFLSGCATSGVKIPETVNIPIAVPCATPDPAQPTYQYEPPYTSVFDAIRDLLGDRELSTAYEIEQRAALKSCK